jgi:hypothetical protein
MSKKKTLPRYSDLTPDEQARVLAHIEDHLLTNVRKGGPAAISDFAFWICNNLDSDAVRAAVDYLAKRHPTK